MTPNLESCQISGTVVEAYESGGQVVLRVAVSAGSIDVPADPGETFHLGDAVTLDGSFHLLVLKHALDAERHSPIAGADFLS